MASAAHERISADLRPHINDTVKRHCRSLVSAGMQSLSPVACAMPTELELSYLGYKGFMWLLQKIWKETMEEAMEKAKAVQKTKPETELEGGVAKEGHLGTTG
jgi:hypothetical protein